MSTALKSQENKHQETIVITAHKNELKEQELLQTIVEYKVRERERERENYLELYLNYITTSRVLNQSIGF